MEKKKKNRTNVNSCVKNTMYFFFFLFFFKGDKNYGSEKSRIFFQSLDLYVLISETKFYQHVEIDALI